MRFITALAISIPVSGCVDRDHGKASNSRRSDSLGQMPDFVTGKLFLYVYKHSLLSLPFLGNFTTLAFAIKAKTSLPSLEAGLLRMLEHTVNAGDSSVGPTANRTDVRWAGRPIGRTTDMPDDCLPRVYRKVHHDPFANLTCAYVSFDLFQGIRRLRKSTNFTSISLHHFT